VLSWARVCVIATSSTQALLIETVLQLIYAALMSTDNGTANNNNNKVSVGLSSDVGCLNLSADVLLISFTHSLSSESGGSARRGNGAGRLAVRKSVDAVEYLVKWGARFAVNPPPPPN
jgi:hypothetical protein